MEKKILVWEPCFFMFFGLFHLHRIWGLIDRNSYAAFWIGEPSGMKLSDWRNTAYHHTYSIDSTGSIKCTYGKENRNIIVLSMQELENYAHKIILINAWQHFGNRKSASHNK